VFEEYFHTSGDYEKALSRIFQQRQGTLIKPQHRIVYLFLSMTLIRLRPKEAVNNWAFFVMMLTAIPRIL
jgi:hypothetical protein